nr:cache domain-containing protein [Spirochaeta isovalerica]
MVLLLQLRYGGENQLFASSDVPQLLEKLCTDNVSYALVRNGEIRLNSAGSDFPDSLDIESRSKIAKSAPVFGDTVLYVFFTHESYEKLIRSGGEEIVRKRILPDNEYVWINHILDYNGGDGYAIRLVHPNLPETEGMLLSTDMTDIMGNLPYRDELSGVNEKGEAFIEYYFKKMNSDEISHKMSYGKLYQDFDWVIATGVYLDDMDSLIRKEYSNIDQHVSQNSRFFLFFVFFIALLAIIVLVLFERNINSLLNTYTSRLKTAQSLGKSSWWEYDLKRGELIVPDDAAKLYGFDTNEETTDFEVLRKAVRSDFRSFFNEKIDDFLKGNEDSIQFPIISGTDGQRWLWLKSRTERDRKGQVVRLIGSLRDITSEKRADEEKEKLIRELKEALEQIKTLGGLIPICSSCKKIRDDSGYWNNLESYIESHSDASFSHGICPDCMEKIYGEKKWYKDKKED